MPTETEAVSLRVSTGRYEEYSVLGTEALTVLQCSSTASKAIQLSCLLWLLKSINSTCFGLFLITR